MSSAGAIRAGRAYVEVGTNNAPLMAGLQQAKARLAAFGSSVQSVGMSLLKMGASVAIPFALGAKAFADFESAMARLKALRSPTEEQFKSLGDLAQKLGLDTKYSATQAAEAMVKLAEAGYQIGDIMKSTGPVLDLAATANIDLAEAARIASNIMNGMQLPASELGVVVDLLAKASTTAANSSIPELGEAFKHVGPQASFAGFKLEDVTAAIQELSSAGIAGEMAGTTLRGVLSSLSAPSTEAAAELKRLHVEIGNGKGGFKSLIDVLGELERAYKGMGELPVMESLGKIFPVRQASNVTKLIAPGAGESLKGRSSSLGDSAGFAGTVAKTQMDTLKGSVDLLVSSLEGLGIVIGKAISPVLRSVGESMMYVTNAIAKWADQNPELFRTITQITIGVIAAGAAVFALGAAIKVTAFALGVMLAPLTLASIAVRIYTNRIFLLTRWLLTAPAMIAKYTESGARAWANFTATMYETGQAVAAVAKTMLSDVMTAVAGIQDALASGDLGEAASIAMLGVKTAFAEATDNLSTWWQGALDRMAGALAITLTDAWASVKVGWVETIAFLGNAWDVLVTNMKVGWNEFTGFMKTRWEANKFWLSDEEVARRAAEIGEQTKAANAETRGAAGASISARHAAKQADLAAIEAERQRAEQDAMATVEAAIKGRAGGGKAAGLRQELEDRRDLAALARGAQEAMDEMEKMMGSGEARKRAERSGLGGALAGAVGRMEAAGTFNARGASMLGAKSTVEKKMDVQIDLQQKIERNTREGGGGGGGLKLT